ncbi:MAG: hypothetical protein ACFB4I_06115 [Cyanophyceae cyanobacterium]
MLNLVTVNAPVFLNLSGSDGSDGLDGIPGTNHFCAGNFSKPAGNGGDGQDGGDGGDGGSLFVLYGSLQDLKKVRLVARGGQGGQGGRGGTRGTGCSCQYVPKQPDFDEIEIPDVDDIEIPDIDINKPKVLLKEKPSRQLSLLRMAALEKSEAGEYQCYTTYGSPGKSGEAGADGQMGSLYLIKQGINFRDDNPTQVVTLSSLEATKTLTLSKNIWQAKLGAANLLAANSIVSDAYYEYSDRLEKAIRLVWEATPSAANFLDAEVKLTLTVGGLEILSPEDIWLATQLSEQNGTAQLAINQIVRREEATQLTQVGLSGEQAALSFNLIDKARKSNMLSTQFYLQYRTARDRYDNRPVHRYRTRFEGMIPASLVRQNEQRFTLNLGQLPIDKQYLQPGMMVEIELIAVRSLSGRSAEQHITWRGEI